MPTGIPTQFSVQWEFEGKASDPTWSVFHAVDADTGEAFDPLDFNDAAAVMGNVWSDTLGPVISNSVHVSRVRVTNPIEGGGVVFEATPGEGSFMCLASEAGVRPYECVLSRWSTASPGRKGRGRTFWPGGHAPALNASGEWDDLHVTDWRAGLDSWLLGMYGEESAPKVALVVYSRTYEEYAQITGVTVRRLVAMQRDRRVGSA